MHFTGAKVMFIEVNSEDEKFLSGHYRSTVQYSCDYASHDDPEQSVREFFDFFFLIHHWYFFSNFSGSGFPEKDRNLQGNVRTGRLWEQFPGGVSLVVHEVQSCQEAFCRSQCQGSSATENGQFHYEFENHFSFAVFDSSRTIGIQ
jgi:hypothetical protein